MLRKLCFISLFACLVFSVTSTSHAASTIEIVDRDFQTVSISLQGRTLHVVGADGLTLNIYNVAGIRVMSFKVDGADRRFELNPLLRIFDLLRCNRHNRSMFYPNHV